MGSELRVLDPERFAMLRELDEGDGEFITTVVNEFETDAQHQVAEMSHALAEDAASALERAAHALKGAAANLGAESLADTCERIQNIGRGGTVDGARGLVDAASLELVAALDALAQELAGV